MAKSRSDALRGNRNAAKDYAAKGLTAAKKGALGAAKLGKAVIKNGYVQGAGATFLGSQVGRGIGLSGYAGGAIGAYTGASQRARLGKGNRGFIAGAAGLGFVGEKGTLSQRLTTASLMGGAALIGTGVGKAARKVSSKLKSKAGVK